MNSKYSFQFAIALAALAATAGSALAATTTLSSGDWQGGAWDNGQPGANDDAVISGDANANGNVDSWGTGTGGILTVDSGVTLGVSGVAADNIAVEEAKTIHLNGGTILANWKTGNTVTADIVLSGGGTIGHTSTGGWNQMHDFTGVVSGSGGLTTLGGNHMGFEFLATNTFTGGLNITSTHRHGVRFSAAGSAGAGDVTLSTTSATSQSGVIVLAADDVFDTGATLTLNGLGWAGSSGGFGPFAGPYNGSTIVLDMGTFNATVAGLVLNDVPMPSGTYSGDSGDWITGSGVLTVTTGEVDTTPPTLLPVDIVDNKSGGPVFQTEIVTYTLTFSEPLNAASVGTDDFENGGSPAATIESVNTTGATVEVVVLPGGEGSLTLQVKTGSTISDIAGNDLVTTTAIADDTTITVNAGNAQTTVTTMTAGSAWVGGTWDMGEPGFQFDTIIAPGVTGSANGAVAPWGELGGAGGDLTLQSGSTLLVTGTDADFIALEGANNIFLNDASVVNNWKSQTVAANWILSGEGTIAINAANSGWNQDQRFSGVISGEGGLTIKGGNHQGMTFLATNTFTGGLTIDHQSQRWGVGLNAPGAAGAGDVTVLAADASGQAAVLVLGADDVFSPTATLDLNGAGWGGSSGGFGPFAGPYNGTTVQLDMKTFNATVGALVLNGVPQAAGTYTDTSGDWITGTGTLTVSGDLGNGFAITEIIYAADTNIVTLTWESTMGEQYTVKYSRDVADFTGASDGDLDDGIDADPGETTTRTFDLNDAQLIAERLFFRVEKQ